MINTSPVFTRYGATPDEWDLLDKVCGLTRDLLPVVSNPNAMISPSSDMKQKGKTPSVYNRYEQVVGMSSWTTHLAAAEEVAKWREQPDFGICLQTRRVRAFDLDVESAEQVAEIEAYVREVLSKDIQGELSVRRRPNSHKCLLAFEVCDIPDDQDLYKRTVKTAHGMIEFLATGQQFIAYGTHPSGVRYAWENEGAFPQLPLHVFEALWTRLVDKFGTSEPTSNQARKRGAVLAGVTDRIIQQLEEKDLVLGWGKDGQAHIVCPFSDEHTTESALSATSYFPAGTGGYALGHFKCLHAHCAHREDQDFMEVLGIGVVAATDMAVLADSNPRLKFEEPQQPPFKRNDDGTVRPTVENIMLALAAPHSCGFHIAKDTFLEEIMLRPWEYSPAALAGADLGWRRLVDEDFIELRVTLEKGCNFMPLNTGTVRECVHAVARRSQFDSAQNFANGLVWDGTPRVDRFFTDYIKTTDAAFGQAVARYLFTALAGRALVGGIKADMVPILIGDQGVMKTSAIEALAPIPDVFAEISLQQNDEQRIRLIKGKLIAEIGEMRGLWNSALEDIKSFITKRNDHWVPKYKEQAVHYPRRCVFVGTGNHHDILNDSTGTRRFLPLTVVSVDLDAIRRDVMQLWAEGVVLYKAQGVMWQDAQRLGERNNSAYTTEDPWVSVVREWLEEKNTDGYDVLTARGGVSTAEVLLHALGHTRTQVNSGTSKRLNEVMRALKLVRVGDLWCAAPAVGRAAG